MRRDIRFDSLGRRSATIACALLVLIASIEAAAQVRTPHEFRAGVDYDGLTQQVVFDRGGNALMATQSSLYSYTSGILKRVAVAADTDTQLALAPAGETYAWLVHDQLPPGLFTVQLTEFPQRHLADLKLTEYPFGFSSLYLGGAGRLIVTATPLDNPESSSGRYRYDFWSRTGRLISTAIHQGRHIGIVDPNGSAILLLGPSSAISYDTNGGVLWRLDGAYRKAALAGDGKFALLNPSQRTDARTLVVYADGAVSRATLSGPVHDLALSAEAADGAVAIDQGRLFFIAPRRCHGSQCNLRPVTALPTASTSIITDMRFIDPATLAIATIEQSGTGSSRTFGAASIHVVDSSGHPVFDLPVILDQPFPGRPVIHVNYGVRSVAAHTPHRTMFVDIGP